jgi:glycosyltransferase involved in cell wall biosynthesis
MPEIYVPAGAEVVVSQIGHLEPRKGQDVLIQAVRMLKSRQQLRPKQVFLLEGQGPMRANLQNLIEKYELSSNIKLIGQVQCVFHLLSQSDILAHPSVAYEDLPNVISEAMSLGKPAVGSTIGGIPEQISNGETGILVRARDVTELADGLWQLISDQYLRSRLGANDLLKFKANFSEIHALDAYKRLYVAKEGTTR